jgi:hypothetical protein
MSSRPRLPSVVRQRHRPMARERDHQRSSSWLWPILGNAVPTYLPNGARRMPLEHARQMVSSGETDAQPELAYGL